MTHRIRITMEFDAPDATREEVALELQAARQAFSEEGKVRATENTIGNLPLVFVSGTAEYVEERP